jgi:hypothetical protein
VVHAGLAGAASLARGVAIAATGAAVEEARLLRAARLELERPSEAAHAAAELASLDWSQLTAAERALCPPVLVVLDEDAIWRELPELFALAAGDLPVLTVLLATGPPAVDVAALPLGFAGQSSPAFPADLDGLLAAALRGGGPALVRLQVPVPASERDGSTLLATARAAVANGDFPLLRPGTAKESSLAAPAPLPLGGEGSDRLRDALRLELALEAQARLRGLLAGRSKGGLA